MVWKLLESHRSAGHLLAAQYAMASFGADSSTIKAAETKLEVFLTAYFLSLEQHSSGSSSRGPSAKPSICSYDNLFDMSQPCLAYAVLVSLSESGSRVSTH